MSSSSSNPTASAGQDELVLLEKVLMRLASADTDKDLTAAVNKFLPPCLLKLSSPQEGVRKKVMELLVHINKRIKNNNNISLPMDALLVQYQDPSATSFVTNFTIIYLKMGFLRMAEEKQAELVPSVLGSIEGKPVSHQDSLIIMLLPVLGSIQVPEDEDKKKNLLRLDEKPAVSKLLTSFLLNYLLLPYGSHPSLRSQDETPEEAAAAPARLHPGLSEQDWKRVAGETPGKAEILEKNKVNVIKFLGKSLLDEKEIALHLIIGTSDTRHSVASQAETVMRKFSGLFDWNDPELIKKIYELFLGTLPLKDRPQVRQELKRAPCNTRIRLKLMPYLLKSREAASQFPECIQVTFDLLFGSNGNSNAKLKLLAVTFIHHIIQHCPESRLNAIGAVLLSALTRLVSEETDNAKLRASCYIAIGKLGLKVPQLVNKDVTMIQTFFEAMTREDKETQLSIQEAMSLMAPSFKQMEKANLRFVEALLSTYIEKDEPQVRLVAVQYAGEVFVSTHEASRYILMIGAGDVKDDVALSARNHLYGMLSKYQQLKDGRMKKYGPSDDVKREEILPDFVSMLTFVLDKANIRIKTQDKFVIGDKTLAFNPKVYVEILDFLRTCLLNSAGVLPDKESLELPDFGAPKVAKYLREISQQPGKEGIIAKFTEFIEQMLSATQGSAQSNAMLQIVGCTFKLSAPNYGKKIAWLKGLLDDTREDIREKIAQLYSLVVAELPDVDFEKAVADLTRSFKEKNLEFQHGIVVALGHSFGRKLMLSRANSSSSNTSEWGSFKSGVELILGQLNHAQPLLVGASCVAIAELGRCGPLPLPDKTESEELKCKFGVVKKLLAILKSGKTSMKVREKAAIALGQLCIGDVEFPHRKHILQECLESAQEIKDIELHFTMGEAVYFASSGPLSPRGRDLWTTEEEDFKPVVQEGSSNEYVEWTLDELCNKYTQSSHPNVKQASCLWLLALTKYGKSLGPVQNRLFDIQGAFMTLLGDNNDLVQDAASKGLGLVYEHSSEDQKNKMVNSLLGSLTSDRQKEVKKVTEDTKIFDEGQMGKTPTGGNLSTYKELCSLASDLNQPDLVYKFMNLANYNSMWNSRKGAAFGFSSIATKAGEQIEPHLPKIVPKLYRYQFDPTPKIQESMSSIWSSLIPETNKTLDKYLPQILEEIITNIVSNQWRVRESCCMALQDLLRGRGLEDALDKLQELWTNLFRVMDDIKESVRLAANKAAQSLSRTCIKMCDVNQGAKAGEAAVKAIMPPLLETGLLSTVQEIRVIVLNTIVKITKNAGALLKPHLALLIPALLEATSELESKEMNYLSVRMANDPSVQEKLDMARITAARTSSMMECVNFVLQYVTAETLEKLIPRVIELIKGHVGIGTKGSAAHLVTTLTHQCPLELQQYTGKILAAFVAGLSDRNAAVRKTYAAAIGHLMKTAKDSSLEKLFVKLRTWYLDKTDEGSKLAVTYTFEAINRHNPDRIKAHASQAMPIVFLAMHEEKEVGVNEEILEIWEEVWSDGTPGTEGGIRLYLKEIMAILTVAIESQQWKMKAQAAKAMGTIAAKLRNTVPEKEQELLLTTLINSLAGRTWDGKEFVIEALAEVCVHGGEGVTKLINSGGAINDKILMSVLLKECKKEKKEYRMVAMEATGKVMRELKLAYFTELYEALFPLIRKELKKEGDKDDGADDEEEENDRTENEKMLSLRHAVYESLGNAWPKDDPGLQEKFIVELVMSLHARVLSTTKKNQLSITKCLNQVLNGWEFQSAKEETREEVFSQVAEILSQILVVPKSSQLRVEALKCLRIVIDLLEEYGNPERVFSFKEVVGKSLDDVVKDVSADAASKATARDLRTALAKLPAKEPPEPMQE